MTSNLRINPELLALFQSGQLGSFTRKELLEAYLALPSVDQKTVKSVRQLINRNVLRLTKNGVLRRVECSGPDSRFEYVGAGRLVAVTSGPDLASANNQDAVGGSVSEVRGLSEKLHRYNMEMLETIGETEEYRALCSEFPHLRSKVQQRYNDARDRCSKLLGRVRALEAILHDNQQA